MSAGNDWADGRHLADTAADAVSEELRTLGGEGPIKIVNLTPGPRNAPAGVREVECDGVRYVVSVVEVSST